MRLLAIAAILFLMWSCHSSGPVSSERVECETKDCSLIRTLLGNQPVTVPYPLELNKTVVTLRPDKIASWRQIAVDAAMSDSKWRRFGGERLIERPYKVDAANIRISALENGCRIVGQELLVSACANCDHIQLVLPTDQHTPCASFYIEVVISRETEQVVSLKDSFWTLSQVSRWDITVERPKGDCGVHWFDKPAHGIPRPGN